MTEHLKQMAVLYDIPFLNLPCTPHTLATNLPYGFNQPQNCLALCILKDINEIAKFQKTNRNIKLAVMGQVVEDTPKVTTTSLDSKLRVNHF